MIMSNKEILQQATLCLEREAQAIQAIAPRLDEQSLLHRYRNIMVRSPKTISRNAKIVEAGETMNHHSIHTLVVVYECPSVSCLPSVVGIIDSFSCLPGTRFYH